MRAASSPGAIPPGRAARNPPGRRARLRALLVAGGVALVLLSPLVGSVALAPPTVFAIVGYEVTGGHFPADPCAPSALTDPVCQAWIAIVWEARLPALLLAALAGAALGLAGATLQGVFRNPLADPYLLGISSGATVGVAVVAVLGIGLAAANLVYPLLAFVGALGSGGVILLAARSRTSSVETLLLTGVAVSSVLSALLAVLLLYASPLSNLQVSYWLLGGLFGATWSRDGIVLGGLLVGGGLLLLFGRELNLLQLGGEVAQSLGVDPPRVRTRLLLLASLATALAVAFTGVIGFVGLVSPHVVRRLFGPDYRRVLPGSALVGGFFLVLAHDLSQLVIPNTELPVGIFTAFAGAPFFLYLLFRQRQAEGMGAGR